jgi:hypothetical protein
MYCKRYNGQIREECTDEIFSEGDGSRNALVYTAWVQGGNTPKFPDPKEDDTDVLRMKCIEKSISLRNTAMASGVPFEGDVYDSEPLSRELLSGLIKTAGKKGSDFTKEIALKNGSVKSLTKQKILALDDAILELGNTIYDSWMSTYKTLLTASRTQLEDYLKS